VEFYCRSSRRSTKKFGVDEQMMRQLVDFTSRRACKACLCWAPPARDRDDHRGAQADRGGDVGSGEEARPLVIHVGTADAGSAVELAVHAAKHGADAVAIGRRIIIPTYRIRIMGITKRCINRCRCRSILRESQILGISIPPGLRCG